MTSNYYIKIYFDKPGQSQPEIRRFPIDISPERDVYGDVHGKVAALLTEHHQTAFSLQYVDEDAERITFSTNDELRAAIALNKGANTLKVYAVAKPAASQGERPQQTTATSGNAERHQGVTCDGCNKEVVGFRFKCLVCPNYDLCETCSTAGVHPEHNMVKITKPGSFHPMGPFFAPPPPHHHGHHHHHRHGRGRHSPHFRGPRPPFAPNPDLLQQIQAQIPQWLPNRENTAHAQEHIKQHLDALKTSAQGHVQNSKEYLQNVGRILQQALSPLGIDCDYHVDEKAPGAAPSTTTTTSTTTASSTTVEQKEEEQPAPAPTTEVPVVDAAASNVEETSDDMVVINHEEMEKEGVPSSVIPIIEDTTPEQAVQGCLEKLTAMGFPSDNVALYRLVSEKHGDINAVLDALNPRN